MAEIEQLFPDDRRGLEQLYRRTYGHEAVDRLRFLWDWARRNPAADAAPPFWVVREGPTAHRRLSADAGSRSASAAPRSSGAWSAGPLVVAERQRQGLGGSLLRAWDRRCGRRLGAGFSDGTRQRLAELRWAKPVPLACLVKPISRRALRRPTWPVGINRLVSALAAAGRARCGPARGRFTRRCRRSDGSTPGSMTCGSGSRARSTLAVRRDARYLNWKFMEPPHVRYQAAVLRRSEAVAGYVIYRHLREPQGRVTQIVDFLADPRTTARSRRWPAGSTARPGSRTPTRSAAMPRTRSSAGSCGATGYFVVKSEVTWPSR